MTQPIRTVSPSTAQQGNPSLKSVVSQPVMEEQQSQQQQHGGQLQEAVSMPPGDVGVTAMNQMGQRRGPMDQAGPIQGQVPFTQQHAQGMDIHNATQPQQNHMSEVPQQGQQQIPQQRNNVPQEALQQLLQTLKSPHSQQQQKQVLTILKSNPQLMAAFIKQRTEHQQRMSQQQQVHVHGQLQQGNMQSSKDVARNPINQMTQPIRTVSPSTAQQGNPSLKSVVSQPVMEEQQSQQQQHGGQLQEAVSMPPGDVGVMAMNQMGQRRGSMDQAGPIQGQVPVMQQHAQGMDIHNATQPQQNHMSEVPQQGQQQIPQQQNNVPQEALQQLLQTLKSPHSQQQQMQVLTILKSNPQLMAAFIKQRTEHQQRMSQQQQEHGQLQQGNMQSSKDC